MKRVVWQELDLQQQILLAAAYGQVHIGDALITVAVDDERFNTESSLPWDAEAHVHLGNDGKTNLYVSGNQGPSGFGYTWSITLPKDVVLSVSIHQETSSQPKRPILEKINTFMTKIQENQEGYALAAAEQVYTAAQKLAESHQYREEDCFEGLEALLLTMRMIAGEARCIHDLDKESV